MSENNKVVTIAEVAHCAEAWAAAEFTKGVLQGNPKHSQDQMKALSDLSSKKREEFQKALYAFQEL